MGILGQRTLTWRSVDRIVILTCLLLTALYGWLGYLDKPGQRIRGSDSIGYYVYLPSIFMDGDLDLADDFKKLGGEDVFLFPALNGRAGNPYSVGPSILWTPWFALGHFAAILTDYPADGYSTPYFFFVYLGNTLYVILGLLLTVRFVKSFDYDPATALFTTLSILLTTQLTYYILPKSATSHGVSYTTVAAFALALRKDGMTWKAGTLGGLAALTRWQNILIIPLLATAVHYKQVRRFALADIKSYCPFAFAAFVAFLPQLIVWQILYDRPFLVPQLEGYVDLTRLPILDVLLSLRHGLITWHPWWFAAMVGLFFWWRANRYWAMAVGTCFLLQLYLNGTVLDWWGTWSFGHRRFVNLLPLMAIGLSSIYLVAQGKYRNYLIAGLLTAGTWNQAFIYQYQRGLIPRSNAPTTTEFFYDKFSLRKVWQAQLAVNTAVQSFRNDDFEGFLHFAKVAHKLYPEYRNTMKVHSVASNVEGRWRQGLDDFDGWLQIEPRSRVAKWGIADIRLKLGQVGQARHLIDQTRITDSLVIRTLRSGEGTLLTRPFFEGYRQELDRIYTE